MLEEKKTHWKNLAFLDVCNNILRCRWEKSVIEELEKYFVFTIILITTYNTYWLWEFVNTLAFSHTSCWLIEMIYFIHMSVAPVYYCQQSSLQTETHPQTTINIPIFLKELASLNMDFPRPNFGLSCCLSILWHFPLRRN